MQLRALTRAGREVTAVGLGTRGLAGGLRGVAPGEAAHAVHVAVEAGCTLIDTDAAWPDAVAAIGEAIRTLRARDRVVVATTVGALAPPPGRAAGSVVRALPPGHVQRAVEDTLRGLRLDVVPLALLGGWRDAWLDDTGWPELLATLHRLVREGKVLAWGVAARDGAAGDAVRAVAEPWVAAVGARYSLFDREAEQALLPAAAAAGVAVLAREPLARGALAGELGPGLEFKPGDERRAWPAARFDALVPELARLATLVRTPPPAASATPAGRAILDRQDRARDRFERTVVELALRFVLDHPAVIAVPGARTAAHALADLACADGRPLTPWVRAALDERPWGDGWYPSS